MPVFMLSHRQCGLFVIAKASGMLPVGEIENTTNAEVYGTNSGEIVAGFCV